MNEAATCHVDEQLRDGRPFTVRAIRPDDKERLLLAFRGLDESSVRSRFFAPRKEPTARELAEATEIDFVGHVALVATVQCQAGERVIGAGRYIRLPSGDGPLIAEVAFVVEEDFHGQGIATALLRHLAAIARKQRIKRFVADILPGNVAMLKVFQRCGSPIETKTVPEAIHVSILL